MEDDMKLRRMVVVLSLLMAPGVAGAHGEEDAAALKASLGSVSFPISCDPQVQGLFNRGVALLHSYWFAEAGKTFAAVSDQDPQCAMAYWGKAVNLLGNTLVAPPPPKDLAAASEAVAKARALGGKTERERDWIESIGAYYQDYDKVPLDARVGAYTRAFEAMTARYPDDFEVSVYYALALQASAPKSDLTYASQRKSAAVLETLVARNPQHPGAVHYLIHAYDYPPLADKGLPAARKYAGIAPAAPHARHMPSHIYSMLGLWQDSIVSNRSALEIQPEYIHAHDFIVYAQLQLAQDQQALVTIEDAKRRYAAVPPTALAFHTAYAAMPARYALERGDWKAAAALPVVKTPFPQADSLNRFARGLGMARSGDVAGAKAEIEAMQALRQALEKANQSYWAARTEEQIYAVSAWVALAAGDKAQAEKLIRAAADGEDASIKHVAMENRLYPMRELVADLLLETGSRAKATAEYEATLRENPNRLRATYGAAMAASLAGDRERAGRYFAQVVELLKSADSSRVEMARAKEYLARK
jgi:tetratricopeptide (TPR) repeat protein